MLTAARRTIAVALLLLSLPGLLCHQILKPQGQPSSPLERRTKARVNPETLPPSEKGNQVNATKYGYVLALQYHGQQTAGIRSLLSHQCWVGSSGLSMLVVEPLLRDSYVEVIRTQGGLNDAFSMADYFDMEKFESGIRQMSYGRLTSWEDFLENAPRNIIHVQTANAKRWGVVTKQVPKVLWESQGSSECYRLSDELEQLKISVVTEDFCIVKVVKLYTTSIVAFTGEDVRDYLLKGWQESNVTLIFDKWVGAWHIPPTHEADSACEGAHELALKGSLHPSKKLIETAKVYEQMFSSESKPFKVAVMIRSEHLIKTIGSQNFQEDFRTCLQEVTDVTYELTSTKVSSKPFVTVDIGKFGSATFRPFPVPVVEMSRLKALRKIKKTVVALSRRNITFEEWEDSFAQATGGIEDRGYIAAVQRTIASRADCIVLVGGGQFLKLALHMYVKAHPLASERCVHFVCVGGRFRNEYRKILKGE